MSLVKWPENMAYDGSSLGELPVEVIENIRDYVDNQHDKGQFLTAVLENNLKEAVFRADGKNVKLIPVYVTFLYSYVPASCWGSPEKVKRWLGGRA